MTDLTAVIALAYAALSGRAVHLWWHRRDAPAARLAVAVACVTIVAVMGLAPDETGGRAVAIVQMTLVLLFLWLLVAFGSAGQRPRTRRFAETPDVALLQADDETAVLEELVDRACALVGTPTAVVLDDRWLIRHHRGDEEDARALVTEAVLAPRHSGDTRVSRTLLAVRLGDGLLVVRTGTSTPLFGRAEIDRLRSLALMGSMALSRVELASREREANHSLAEREAQLREAQALALLSAWRWDVETGEITWSIDTHRIFGVDVSKRGTASEAMALVHPDDREEFARCFDAAAATGEAFEVEHRHLSPDGELRWVHVRGRPVVVGGAVVAVHGVSQDVTAQRATAEELRQRALQQAAVATLGQRAVAMGNLRAIAREAAEVTQQILGVARAIVVEHVGPQRRLVAATGVPVPGAAATVVALDAAGGRIGDLVVDVGDRVLEDHEREFLESVAAIISGVAERERVESRLAHQATHDPLTGLPNRALLRCHLQRALETSQRTGEQVAVLFLDLDRFKLVNDSLGHGAGDALLEAVAERLQLAVRRSAVVARFGGDEFVVVAEGADDAAARRIADSLRAALVPLISMPGHELQTTASIGIVVADGSDDADGVLRDADAAMYEAKDAGRDRAVKFGHAVRHRAAARLSIEHELRAALDTGRVAVAYQPVLAVGTGRIRGVEALARLTGADGEPISPAEFVPVAEESGLIEVLGTAILEQACADATAWSTANGPLSLSVNVSGRQLRSPRFAKHVSRVVERTGFPMERLCLEITESTLVDDAELVRVMHTLRDAGLRLSIDDFGTGYSALAYLKDLPVDELKIDRVFVDRLPSVEAEVLMGAILGITTALGMTAVAEGVERPGQMLSLHRLGCPLAQGFLLGRPTSANDIAELAGSAGDLDRVVAAGGR